MTDRLSLSQIAALMAYAVAMAGGQLLFKMAALRGAGAGPLGERMAGFLLNGYFIIALILYAALSVTWVWILSFTPLTRAYPFVALAFALTPALASFAFAEPVSLRLLIGIVLVSCGIFFIAG
jgi:drug/metabolite transporter (DMT)-like permease